MITQKANLIKAREEYIAAYECFQEVDKQVSAQIAANPNWMRQYPPLLDTQFPVGNGDTWSYNGMYQLLMRKTDELLYATKNYLNLVPEPCLGTLNLIDRALSGRADLRNLLVEHVMSIDLEEQVAA